MDGESEPETSTSAIAEAGGEFAVEGVSVGAYANGFGRTADGLPFAFRIVNRALRVEIYRDGIDSDVPEPADLVAVAHAPITDVDLTDERSIVAMVRDAVDAAEPVNTTSGYATVRAMLNRLGSVL
ncbi:hypothetical protein FOS14_03890 [Skermania sp. ID1734]|uniref:hypothetical protein n=1 Tax=Skermania sp. ID1734 TaxID=2597516 RepID=UPI00117D2AE7|nr:hypothetical protein [Skermania sp. ID1734]TSE01672.1 hypothetical protein FOS14_03890 [Skermania sp. ID1734]